VCDEWLEGLAAPQCVSQIRLNVAEQTRPQLPIGSQAHAITTITIVVAHRCNHADRAARTRELEIRGRPITMRAMYRLQLRDPFQALQNLDG
jgi:hypothetical protein